MKIQTSLKKLFPRIVCYNNESHSKNYFSNATNADTAAILKETLNTPDSTSGNSTWLIRACFNCVAMLAMLMSIVVLTHLLLKKPFFSSCIAEKTTTERKPFFQYYLSYLPSSLFTKQTAADRYGQTRSEREYCQMFSDSLQQVQLRYGL